MAELFGCFKWNQFTILNTILFLALFEIFIAVCHFFFLTASNDALAILGPDPFSTIASGSSYINVYERSHGRDTSDTVRFRGPIWTSSDADGFQNPVTFDGISGSNIAKSGGYSITVGKRDSSGDVTATDDYYYFTVDTNTATSGGVSGGGNNCTAGPATLED